MNRARIVASTSVLAIMLVTASAAAAPCTSDASCDEGYACVELGDGPTCWPKPKTAVVVVPKTSAAVYESYGTQTMATDLASLGLLGTALAARSGGLAFAGVGTYWLGAPIVHFAHGNLIGFGSLGLRIFGPPVGFFAGALVGGLVVSGTSGGRGEYGAYGGAIVGGLFGFGGSVIAISLVDSLVFAKERVESPKEKSALAFRPYGAPEKRGAQAGLSLTF